METTIEDAPLGGVCGERKETDENQRDVISREFPLLFPSFYISFLFSFSPSFPPFLLDRVSSLRKWERLILDKRKNP